MTVHCLTFITIQEEFKGGKTTENKNMSRKWVSKKGGKKQQRTRTGKQQRKKKTTENKDVNQEGDQTKRFKVASPHNLMTKSCQNYSLHKLSLTHVTVLRFSSYTPPSSLS